MKCATHPEIETNLRCGKCGKPICPKCLVQTPVGARCPDCAKLYKLPTYRVSAKYYLRAVGTALGMAIVCGVVWGVVRNFVPFFYFNLLLAPGAGYAIGEVVSLSVNRKRGTGLAIVASFGVILSYLISIFLPLLFPFGLFHFGLFRTLLDLVALALGIFVAVTRLR
ncbi:MAG: B-box zinc finger protein [Dehalococcoidales bacterium]